ncbi:12918_t:CDS:2 [Entrophospora sp. SA101]|nr:12918_t:CDS:2 [Entrophospora sp. SA101]CAJ0843654.1 7992_t:CDS:2 [Entrophospora sp. SA101]CAJ0899302.1 14346_t:CDS:2 [Entrophospora sp. SA101]
MNYTENSTETRQVYIDVVDKVVTRLWLIIWNVLLVSVVVIKSAHVSKGLSTAMNTVLITNPSLPKQLNHQKCTGGFLLEFNSLAGPASGSINIREAQKSLEEIKSDKNLGYKEREDYFTVKTTVAYIHNKGKELIYLSWSTCKKKVFVSDNNWSCDKC